MDGPAANTELDGGTLESALAAARAARARAHAPHSGFRVGAAVVTSGGEAESGRGVHTGCSVHTGCNVESASYGLTLCAERAALASWIDAGGLARGESVEAVVISTQSSTPTAPCGACRQWIAELAPRATVISEAEPVPGAEPGGGDDGGAGRDGASADDGGQERLGGGGGGAALPGRPGSRVARWEIGELLPHAFGRADLPPSGPATC